MPASARRRLAWPLHSLDSMSWNRAAGPVEGGSFRIDASTEVDAPVAEVFARWSRFDELPRCMESVRRTKRIGERCVLWDVDILGRQLVWEARIVESLPEKRIRWTSRWGARHVGAVSFEPLSDARTRIRVEIEYQPRGLIERLGAWLGVVDLHVRRDLDLFRRSLEQETRRAAA